MAYIMKILKIICCITMLYLSLNAAAQAKQTLIVKINNNSKTQKLLANNGMQAAINLPSISQKMNNRLMANSKAAMLLEELKTYYHIQVDTNQILTTMNMLQAQHGITSVVPSVVYKLNQDKVKTNDPMYAAQWSLKAIEAESAWNIATGKGIVVGIIDTGIEYDHDELKDQLWVNSGEDINGNGRFDNWSHKTAIDGVYGDLDGIDNDGNGYIDDVIGYDFIDYRVIHYGDVSIPDPNPSDEHGHGTAVASVIAAKHNNNIGLTGIAFDAKIMAMRTFDAAGNGECKDIANAIVYAVLNGANVINMSFGEYESSPIMHTAVKFAEAMGCILIASSGNDGLTLPHYPSDYPEVISVGGCDSSFRQVFNYGDRLAITAPGTSICAATIDNGYTVKDGTSFSSPIVASVAAMLLEKDNTLNPQEIKGIIQTTATQVAKGWTEQYGAGIVNAYQALQYISKTKLEITAPTNDAAINVSKQDTLVVTGSTATPLFDSYILRIRKDSAASDDNNLWDTLVVAQHNAVLDDTLGKCYIGKYGSFMNIYSLSLLVNLKNGNTYETRNRIKLCSDDNTIKINRLAVYTPYYYDSRAVMFNMQTNTPCNAVFYYREKGKDTEYNAVTSSEYYTDNHVVACYDIPADIDMEGYALAMLNGADTVRMDLNFTKNSDHFDSYTFKKKAFELPTSYFYQKPVRLYGNDRVQLIANDITSALSYANTYIYEYQANGFVMTDSMSQLAIPVGAGDSNGDGVPDILGMNYGISKVYERKNQAASNFSDVLFTTSEDGFNLACAMVDMDNDAVDELIINDNNSSICAYSFKDGQYQQVMRIDVRSVMYDILPDSLKSRNYKIYNSIATGDFDGNGKLDIAAYVYYEKTMLPIGKTYVFDEYFLIFEIDNFNATLKDWRHYTHRHASGQQHYLASCNLNNDGKDDIICLQYGKVGNLETPYGASEIWTYSVLMYDGENKLQQVFEDDILGVRLSPFRNCLMGGNLDNEAGDEVVIGAFPNIYVLKWNEADKSMKPLWNYPASLTNSAVIGDIDGNGKPELGFCTFNASEFFEYNSDYTVGTEVTGFDGWATSNTSLYFIWKEAAAGMNYELFLIETAKLSDPLAQFTVYQAQGNHIEINSLTANTGYTAYIKIAGSEYYSMPLELYTHSPVKPVSAGYMSNGLVQVKFDGLLPYQVNSANFMILHIDSDAIIPVAEVSSMKDTTAILNLQGNPPAGEYMLRIASFRDYYGNYTISDTLYFNVTHNISSELYLSQLTFEPPNNIVLEFSEPAQGNEALNINNYSFSPVGSVEQIWSIDANRIKILLSQDVVDGRGKDYLITASTNIISDYGNAMTRGSGNTLGFTVAEKDVKSVYLYPNPVKLTKTNTAYIGHLTPQATVEIMTVDGKLLRRLDEYDANGGVEWDLRDSGGNILDIGVYLIKTIDNSSGSKDQLTKFAITE